MHLSYRNCLNQCMVFNINIKWDAFVAARCFQKYFVKMYFGNVFITFILVYYDIMIFLINGVFFLFVSLGCVSRAYFREENSRSEE